MAVVNRPYTPITRLGSLVILSALIFSVAGIYDVRPAYADKAGVCGTPGKDGPTTTLTGVVNTYYPGSANVTAGATSIPVGAARGGGGPAIAAGDLLLVVQMQGADINSTNDETYGDGVGTLGVHGNSVAYNPTTTYPPAAPPNAYAGGNVSNSNFTAGNYEYVVATGPVAAGSVPILSGLANNYFEAAYGAQGQRTYQVVRVPQYSDVILTGAVTASAWNGSTGGIVAFDVAGNLNWNGQIVNVNGLGFRGGAGFQKRGLAGLNNWDYRVTAPAPPTRRYCYRCRWLKGGRVCRNSSLFEQWGYSLF